MPTDKDLPTREEVVKFIERQLHYSYKCPREKGIQFHYGKQELRELLDFIYGGPPATDSEKLGTDTGEVTMPNIPATDTAPQPGDTSASACCSDPNCDLPEHD